MKNKILNIIILLIITITITSCETYAKFEIGRYMIAFVVSLVIGVIGLISLSGKNKK